MHHFYSSHFIEIAKMNLDMGKLEYKQRFI
jgi:hypothetical protein